MTSLLRRRARTEDPDAPVISMVDVGMTYPNGKVALAKLDTLKPDLVTPDTVPVILLIFEISPPALVP